MDDTENKPKAAPRGRGGFQKGKSGNPGGRPKEREEFKLKARRIVDEYVLKAWEDEIREKGSGWVKCSELVTAYALGKPASAPEDNAALAQSGSVALTQLTREEMLAELKKGDE